jgi:hypothetical protein
MNSKVFYDEAEETALLNHFATATEIFGRTAMLWMAN